MQEIGLIQLRRALYECGIELPGFISLGVRDALKPTDL
jgi:hypothetical protein